jgi:hypothetical protein
MRRWLHTISGEHVTFTGKAWLRRRELERIVKRLGSTPARAGKVTAETTLLVRGESRAWAYGDYGTKERRAAELIRAGQDIAVVHDFEFRKLLKSGQRVKTLDRVAGQPIEWLTVPDRRQFTKVAQIAGPLDREHSVKGRIEQGFLRRALFQGAQDSTCSLCRRRLPIELLVAAHIKPRSECTRRERLDAPNIVFGICVLGCDALYERGLISVGEDGRIRVAQLADARTVTKILRAYAKKTCNAWTPQNARYFEWHSSRRFQS